MSANVASAANLPTDYVERVYAGVLGKLIGVYLGRPFEGWTHERIMAELGEVWYYVHDRLHVPLVVTDDDITGTFTFLRALADHGYSRALSAEQIGQAWLNYIIEGQTILWWGGFGYSTEHTAYLRLKQGIPAPHSGSIQTNGQLVAEQIGAQIFIDGWAMVAPNDPHLAATLAGRAASVSHDGAAKHAAQLWAAMEAAAFTESNIEALLDIGLAHIPADSIIRTLITDVRAWHQTIRDWREARAQLAAHYGYDKYGGACHVVPNHGVMILALLYGDDDFQKTLMIANTCGWDTDCNSGNVGCFMGIKNGLTGIDTLVGPDWRGPLADQLYLPTADGGRAITDAVLETYHVVNGGRALAGLPPLAPKDGARFHFSLAGSVQGFRVQQEIGTVTNALLGDNQHCLALKFMAGQPFLVTTPTFIPIEASGFRSYHLLASPTLYAGQTIKARLIADSANTLPLTCRLTLASYGAQDALVWHDGPTVTLAANEAHSLTWLVPDMGGAPIAQVGFRLDGPADGVLYIDYLTWGSAPTLVLGRAPGNLWKQAWVSSIFRLRETSKHPFHLVQNEGIGLISQGTADWRDYRVEVNLTPHLCNAAGVAIRVQGLRRYYAAMLVAGGKIQLIKMVDKPIILAEIDFPWQIDQLIHVQLSAVGDQLHCIVSNAHEQIECTVIDTDQPLPAGGMALVLERGCLAADEIRVTALA